MYMITYVQLYTGVNKGFYLKKKIFTNKQIKFYKNKFLNSNITKISHRHNYFYGV